MDPVGVVRRFSHPLDREIVGLVAAGLAFGNVKTIRAKLEELLERVGESPHVKAEDARALKNRFSPFVIACSSATTSRA